MRDANGALGAPWCCKINSQLHLFVLFCFVSCNPCPGHGSLLEKQLFSQIVSSPLQSVLSFSVNNAQGPHLKNNSYPFCFHARKLASCQHRACALPPRTAKLNQRIFVFPLKSWEDEPVFTAMPNSFQRAFLSCSLLVSVIFHNLTRMYFSSPTPHQPTSISSSDLTS